MTNKSKIEMTNREMHFLYLVFDGEKPTLEILEKTNDFFNKSYNLAHCHTELHAMEARGWMTSRFSDERPPERGGNRRKYYKITEAGRKAFFGHLLDGVLHDEYPK